MTLEDFGDSLPLLLGLFNQQLLNQMKGAS